MGGRSGGDLGEGLWGFGGELGRLVRGGLGGLGEIGETTHLLLAPTEHRVPSTQPRPVPKTTLAPDISDGRPSMSLPKSFETKLFPRGVFFHPIL